LAEQRNPNHILGVPVGANKATIEAAYRRLARRYHPDLNVDPDATTQMQDINWARDVLLDPHKRYHWAHHAQSDRRPYTHYTHSYTTRARTQTRARPRQADRDDQEWGKPYTSEQERYWERTRVKSPLFDDVPFGSPLQGCVLDQRTVWGMVALLGFVLIYYVAEALFGPAPHNSQPAFALPSGMAGFVIETATQREQVQAVLDYAARKSPPAVTVESGGRVIGIRVMKQRAITARRTSTISSNGNYTGVSAMRSRLNRTSS
jgi:hypothetical protein